MNSQSQSVDACLTKCRANLFFLLEILRVFLFVCIYSLYTRTDIDKLGVNFHGLLFHDSMNIVIGIEPIKLGQGFGSASLFHIYVLSSW